MQVQPYRYFISCLYHVLSPPTESLSSNEVWGKGGYSFVSMNTISRIRDLLFHKMNFCPMGLRAQRIHCSLFISLDGLSENEVFLVI